MIERSGKTLALLKASSKPSKSDRKNKKIEILGTYKEYQDSKKKQAAGPPVGQPSAKVDPNPNASAVAPQPNVGTRADAVLFNIYPQGKADVEMKQKKK